MKQPERVRAFKNELRTYRFNLTRIEALQSLIDICYSHLPGSVHGSDPSRIPMASVPDKDLEYRIRNEIDRHERNKSLTEAKVRYCDEILNKMETSLKEAVMHIYVDGNTMESIARKMYLSTNALQHRINKELGRILDDQNEEKI